MSSLSVFRSLLTLILFGLFVWAIVNAIKNLLAQETGTSMEYISGGCPMPFLSICPNNFAPNGSYTKVMRGSNKTLVEFYNETPSMKSFFKPDGDETFYYGQSKTLEPLLSRMPMTEFVTTNTLESRLIRCVTLDTSGLPVPKDSVTIRLSFNMSDSILGLTVEKHSFNEATGPGFKEKADMITFLTPGTDKLEIIKIHERVNLDLPRNRCDPDNKQIFDVCNINYLTYKLGCNLPWMLDRPGIVKRKRLCDLPEDLDNYIETALAIRTGKVDDELITFGCLKPNCVTDEWYILSRDAYPNPAEETSASIVLETTPNNCLKVTRQILLYGFSNFVADFGGYLGLLLGASLLSLFDSGVEFITSMSKKLNNNGRYSATLK